MEIRVGDVIVWNDGVTETVVRVREDGRWQSRYSNGTEGDDPDQESEWWDWNQYRNGAVLSEASRVKRILEKYD